MPSLIDEFSDTLSHVVVKVTTRIAGLHSVFLWFLAYIVSLALMYLFHSPFRAHTACRTDWYAQITKFLQIWLAAVVLFFHLGPHFFAIEEHRADGRSASSVGADDGGVALVFIPIFSALNMLFLFLHKIKRKLRLGVTYGAGFTVILLNSILLSVFTLVHYAACFEVTLALRAKLDQRRDVCAAHAEDPRGWCLSSAVTYRLSGGGLSTATVPLMAVCPTSHVLAKPFGTIAHLLVVDILFILLDYRYKAYRGFDPTRGILFADLYRIRKSTDAAAALQSSAALTDAGTLTGHKVAKGGMRGPAKRKHQGLATRSTTSTASGDEGHGPGHRAGFSGTRDSASDDDVGDSENEGDSLTVRQPAPASTWWWSWWWWHVTRNEAKMREAYRRYDFRYGEPKPVRIHPRQTRRAAAKITSTQANGSKEEAAWVETVSQTSLASVPDDASSGVGSEEKVSFRMSKAALAEAKSAAHPDNRTGMVPWFSTFILNTSWQAVTYEALAFLVFDVRILQETQRPKVFDLSFYPKLSRIEAARTRHRQQHQQQQPQRRPQTPSRQSTLEASPLTRACVSTSTNMPVSSPATAAPTPSLVDHRATARLASDPERTPPTPPHHAHPMADGAESVASSAEEADVWFDWIADIGDGFNSTYEMARLVAQPVLSVRDVGSWMAAGSRSRLRSADSPTARAAAAHGSRKGKARRSHSLGDVSDNGSFARMRSHTPPAFPSPPLSSAGRPLEPSLPSPASALPPSMADAVPAHTPVARLSSDTNFPSAASPMAAANLCGLPSTARTAARDDASAADGVLPSGAVGLLGSQSGYGTTNPSGGPDGFQYHLPRGSFLLVGGDLAYPNPNDETFLTRFIGPYNDALRSHRRLQRLVHEREDMVVEEDATDPDVTHIRMLEATVISDIALGKRNVFGQEKGSIEEAVRSVPLLFSIPGNHEWLDGLSTYRKYILENTWVGGWFMPQKTSYFVLKLPHNWFILCTDCGTQKDINPSQRNYFLEVVEKYMDAESCVILTSHEPGWIYDAMLRKNKATQPELNRLAQALGTRLRMWLAGDIHHYSRHTPRDPTSEAPTLVVSGSGGAFMHGPRRSAVIHQGTEYVRTTAFPHGNTYMSLVSRLIAFRLINWKFDLVVGACCFFVVMSMLPQPYGTAGMEAIHDVGDFASAWTALTWAIIQHLFSKAVISLVAVLCFFAGFFSAGAENGVPILARAVHGSLWTSLVILSCCGMLAYVECCIGYMANHGMLMSSEGTWGSALDEHVRSTTDTLLNHTRELLGVESRAARSLWQVQQRFYGGELVALCSLLLRCMDPVETLAFLSVKVSSPGLSMGKISPDATRTEVVLYYLNFLFFYWILVTPLVSFLIGCFLFVSATFLDCLYDPAYSAFQIEDFKGFLRLRIEAKTRELHVYVIAEEKVPKSWDLDSRHVGEMNKYHRNTAGGVPTGTSEQQRGSTSAAVPPAVPPPHLWKHPSRWRSSIDTDVDPRGTPSRHGRLSNASVRGMPEVLEHFVCRPHYVERVEVCDASTEAASAHDNLSDVGL